jgi:hypothetical protein
LNEKLFNQHYETDIIAAIIFISTSFAEAQKIGINIGDKAPELIGTSPDGKTIKLSDTKGKVVLLDFWAAGVAVPPRKPHCGQCLSNI